jgi:hypothetical protein
MKTIDWKIFNFGILLGLNYLDFLTTKIILALGGAEWNPLMAYLIDHFGIYSVLWFKLFVLGILLLLIQKISLRVMMLLNVVYMCVVAGNVLIFLTAIAGN